MPIFHLFSAERVNSKGQLDGQCRLGECLPRFCSHHLVWSSGFPPFLLITGGFGTPPDQTPGRCSIDSLIVKILCPKCPWRFIMFQFLFYFFSPPFFWQCPNPSVCWSNTIVSKTPFTPAERLYCTCSAIVGGTPNMACKRCKTHKLERSKMLSGLLCRVVACRVVYSSKWAALCCHAKKHAGENGA